MARAGSSSPSICPSSRRSPSIPSHPFPFIQNGGLTVGVELRRERDGTTMHALLPIPSQLARFIRLPLDETRARRRHDAHPLHPHRVDDRHVPVAPVSGLPGPQPRRLPGPARQRHRGAGGGRGSRRALRDRAQAPPPRQRHPARDRRADADAPAALRGAGARDPRRRRVHQGGHAGARRHVPADRVGAARSRLQALQHPLPRAHSRVQRRLLRRHPQEGHRGAPPLRVLRCGGAAAASGRRRPQCAGHQVDALSHLQRQPHRARCSRTPPISASR